MCDCEQPNLCQADKGLVKISSYEPLSLPTCLNLSKIRALTLCYSKLEVINILPPTLEVLTMTNNKIMNITVDFPKTLHTLNVSVNRLQTLNLSGSNIISCICNNNNIEYFFGSDKLNDLDLDYNPIVSIHVPDTLSSLSVSNCGLQKLPLITHKLICLKANNNEITNLEYLPQSLLELHATGNFITNLKCPPQLSFLSISSNKITKLELPKTIEIVYCSSNEITKVIHKNIRLRHLVINDNPVKYIHVNKSTLLECDNMYKKIDPVVVKPLKTITFSIKHMKHKIEYHNYEQVIWGNVYHIVRYNTAATMIQRAFRNYIGKHYELIPMEAEPIKIKI